MRRRSRPRLGRMAEPDAAEAEAYFRERRWRLRTHHDEGKWWADLVSTDSDLDVPRYGVGASEAAAIVSAKQRWVVEQEPPQPLARRLP